MKKIILRAICMSLCLLFINAVYSQNDLLRVVGYGNFLDDADNPVYATKIDPGGISILKNGSKLAHLGGWPNAPHLGLLKTFNNQNGMHRPIAMLGTDTLSGLGLATVYGLNSLNVWIGGLGYTGPEREHGYIGVYDTTGGLRVELFVNSFETGDLRTFGPNGYVNFWLTYLSSVEPDQGYTAVCNHDGWSVSILHSFDDGGLFATTNASAFYRTIAALDSMGQSESATYGANGNRNCVLGISFDDINNGGIGVYDENDDQQAHIFVDSNGDGVLSADIKSFVSDYPGRPDFEIWYASVEGPKVAIYDRGTAKLENGEAFIPFSEHFAVLMSPETANIHLTPLSVQSKGISVASIGTEGFLVREKGGGIGSYSFDWEIKAVRKGMENHQAIRSKTERPVNDHFKSNQKSRRP